MEAAPDPGNIIAFLLQQGVGEATDVLLIDESLCVRCDNCEKACADVHDGTSRLDREAGPTFAEIHVPTSCRHCEHPHCMKDCPPDAIHRSPNGEVFMNDSCIGCGNCEKNCPYGVIQLAPVDPKRRRPSLLSWLALGLGPEPGLEPKPKGKDIPKKAVKCDMCKDLTGGAACVRACPTGAAIRVSPDEFLNYAATSEAWPRRGGGRGPGDWKLRNPGLASMTTRWVPKNSRPDNTRQPSNFYPSNATALRSVTLGGREPRISQHFRPPGPTATQRGAFDSRKLRSGASSLDDISTE